MLATYADQFYKGKAAATRRRLGRGEVIYVGVDTMTGEMEADVVRKIYDDAGAHPANLPADFMIDWRDGFWTASNFSDVVQSAPAAADANFVVGTRSVPPGGTAVWQ